MSQNLKKCQFIIATLIKSRLKFSFTEKAIKIWEIFLLISRRQNHEKDCSNFCGLLRKAELYLRQVRHSGYLGQTKEGSDGKFKTYIHMRFVESKVRNLLHRGCYKLFDWLKKPLVKSIFSLLVLQKYFSTNIYRELFCDNQCMYLFLKRIKKNGKELFLTFPVCF